MPTAHKVLVKAGESALGCNSADTTATTSSATELDSSLKAEEGTHANSNNMEVEHELPGEDDVFGYVKIYGETTSVRYELQQLKIFYETYGKSPTLNLNNIKFYIYNARIVLFISVLNISNNAYCT